MKRVGYIFLAIAFMQSFMSCELETSNNGNLDGFWHLVSIDTLSTSGHADMSQQMLFWSFQNKLMTLRDKQNAHKNIVSRFNKTDNILKLYSPCIDNREAGDVVLKDAEELRPYGVNSIEEYLEIEKLDKKRMTLKSQTLRLRFEKM